MDVDKRARAERVNSLLSKEFLLTRCCSRLKLAKMQCNKTQQGLSLIFPVQTLFPVNKY